MRPVDPDAVADLAAEQLVAGHAQRLGLGVEQGVLDGAQRLGDDAAGSRPRGAVELGIDALVLARRLADDARPSRSITVATPGEPKPSSNSLQPTMPVVGRKLDEMVVAPAGIAGQRFDARDFHVAPPVWRAQPSMG